MHGETSTQYTMYSIEGMLNHTKQMIEALGETVFRPHFNQKVVDFQRLVILKEKDEDDSNGSRVVFEKMLETAYPVKYKTAALTGDSLDIKCISLKNLEVRRYFRNFVLY